eukprot:14417796-Alexandrium_andersonii.AAC.1
MPPAGCGAHASLRSSPLRGRAAAFAGPRVSRSSAGRSALRFVVERSAFALAFCLAHAPSSRGDCRMVSDLRPAALWPSRCAEGGGGFRRAA